MPEPSAFEVELAIEKLQSHKSPGIDLIPAELIKEGGRTIRYQIHKIIVSIWNKEELPEEWKSRSLYLSIRGTKTDCNNYRGRSLLPNYIRNIVQHPSLKVNSICRGNYWGSSMWVPTQQVDY